MDRIENTRCETKVLRNTGTSIHLKKPLNGFTLIELLVVISIIALLVAILVPSLSQAREQAKRVVCLSNLRQIGVGIQIYTQTYDDYVFQGMYLNNGQFRVYSPRRAEVGWGGFGYLWTSKIIDAGEVFFCPSQKFFRYEDSAASWYASTHESISCSYGYRGLGGPMKINKLNKNSAMCDTVVLGHDAPYHIDRYNVLCFDASVAPFVDLQGDIQRLPKSGGMGITYRGNWEYAFVAFDSLRH